MAKTPSPNGSNGRDSRGRFTRGNAGGPGNPHARRTAEIRTRLLDLAEDERVDRIVQKLMALAESGDLPAIKEFFNRTIGKAVAMDLLQRVEAIEQALEERP